MSGCDIKVSVQADAKAEITNEDVRKRAQLRQLDAAKAQALAVTKAGLSMVGSGFMSLLSDPSQLARFVGATVALAAGVYTARESAKLGRQRLAAVLGRPSLVRETSRVAVLKPIAAARIIWQRIQVRKNELNFWTISAHFGQAFSTGL